MAEPTTSAVNSAENGSLAPGGDNNPINPNPHLEQKPDFSLSGFDTRRKRLTDRGMANNDAVAFLSEEWDEEHAKRLACWDAARALAPRSATPTTLPSTPRPGLGSNVPLPAAHNSSTNDDPVQVEPTPDRTRQSCSGCRSRIHARHSDQ